MALLDAFIEYRRETLAGVATFDHGTGSAATAASKLVVQACLRHAIPVVVGSVTVEAGPARARPQRDAPRPRSGAGLPASTRPTEARWREARWIFLRRAASEFRATIVTAHTLDDQAETVAMRILRGATARGIAAMAAPTPGVARPLLGIRRAELARWAAVRGVRFVEDPSNARSAYLRNRVRGDLLAAIERRQPGFAEELVALGERAGEWRRRLSDLVDGLDPTRIGAALVIDAGRLTPLTTAGLGVVWPELLARVGIAMDRRGVARAVHWTPTARAGQRIPLSGGASIERTARTFVVRPPAPAEPARTSP